MVRLRLAVCLGVAVWLGILNTNASAGYLFGNTGGTPNYLDVTTTSGSLSLSTATNPINPGSNNQGWWSRGSLVNSNDNDSFQVGTHPNQNNYFTFDISALQGQTVTGIFLNIQNPGANDCPMTYLLYDVSTHPDVLAAKDHNPDVGIYLDLQSGTLYGQQVIPKVSLPQYWIPLNANAVADLNEAIIRGEMYFSVGGQVLPEPSALALSSLGGLVLMGLQLRRRQRLSRGV